MATSDFRIKEPFMNLLSAAMGTTLLSAAVALVASIATGYGTVALRRARTPQRWPRLASALPVLVGVLAGMGTLATGLDPIILGDRFYSPESARQVFWVTVGALVALLLLVGTSLVLTRTRNTGGPLRRMGGWAFFVVLLLLSTALALNGMRFGVLGAGLDQELDLGRTAVPFSVLWLLVAAYALRLLDGLHGAVPAVVGAAAVAVGWMSYANEARLVAAMCAVMAAGAFGALRFHAVPSPSLPLRGPATVCFGLLFAILTLVARQKTVATLLLLFPLALAVLLLGAAMLATLERSLQPGADESGTEDEGEGGIERLDEGSTRQDGTGPS
jgi:hypothetical protein